MKKEDIEKDFSKVSERYSEKLKSMYTSNPALASFFSEAFARTLSELVQLSIMSQVSFKVIID